MKLTKVYWKLIKLGSLCERVRTVNSQKMTGTFNYVDIGSIDSSSKRITTLQQIDWKDASSRARQIIAKGDTLFSTVRVNLERIAYIDKEVLDGIASTGFTVIRGNNSVLSVYLFYAVSSPFFIEKLVRLQKGTAYPAVTDKIVFDQEIPLPPLEEQKQIVELFQSIDTTIEKVEEQENRLKALRKFLIDKLTRKHPRFGNLINRDNCNEYSIGEISKEILDRADDPSTSGFKKFIGLENFESGDLTIQKYSSSERLISAVKICKKGNVLLARRNIYLKRVSLTEFDAICSGDVIVIKADEKIILPKFLVLVMNTKEFWDYAIAYAAGSMSKRVKWRDLIRYKLELPDIKTQTEILNVFDSLEETLLRLKRQHLTLIALKQQLLNEILG